MGRSRRVWINESGSVVYLRPIAEAPRDGREILCTDGVCWKVCVPKEFTDDIWEFFRTAAGPNVHSWSIAPTHFVLIEELPKPAGAISDA